MKWSKALKLAVPVWLLVCAVTAAINYAADAQATVIKLIIGLAAAYPLTAFILRATAEDVVRWRAVFGSKSGK